MTRSPGLQMILFGAAVALLAASTAIMPASRLHAQGGTPSATVGTGAYTDSDVDIAAALGRLEGHLASSFSLWKAGQFQLAATHAAHTIAQYFASLAEPLTGKEGETLLKGALDAYQALAAKAGGASANDVQKAHDAVMVAIDRVQQMLLGAVLTDLKFQGEVVATLIDNVKDDYAAGVSGGKITNPVEYQDALSFFVIAARNYGKYLSAGFAADHADDAKIIANQLEFFASVFPNFDVVKPPDTATNPEDVEKAADLVIAMLRKDLNLPEKVSESVEKAIDGIKEKVKMAISEYKAGHTDQAYELAASAYLDGFEALEADLIKKDKDLMTTLEKQFKDLRDGIQANAPVADLEQLAEAIAENLQKAEDLLKG